MFLKLARLRASHVTRFAVIKSWLKMAVLIDRSKRKPNVKNRADEAIEKVVLDYAVHQPTHGQHRTRNELRSKVSSCLAAALALSGLGMASRTSKSACKHWKPKLHPWSGKS